MLWEKKVDQANFRHFKSHSMNCEEIAIRITLNCLPLLPEVLTVSSVILEYSYWLEKKMSSLLGVYEITG